GVIRRIPRILILLDGVAQLRIGYTIWIDAHHLPGSLIAYLLRVFNAYHLIRRNKHHDAFIKIILLLTLIKFNTTISFQGNAIKIIHKVFGFGEATKIFHIDYTN